MAGPDPYVRRVAHAPYPWGFLARVPGAAVRGARELRPLLDRVTDPRRMARALGELVAADVSFIVRRTVPSTLPSSGPLLHLECDEIGLTLVIELEPALATALLARVLGRAPGLTRPDEPLDRSSAGALSALVVEAARRAESELPLRARAGPPPPGGSGLRADATIFLDGKPHRATVWAARDERPTRDEPRTGAVPGLAALGTLPLSIPVVAAVSLSPRDDVERLRPGDVFLPGQWLHGDRREGEATWDAILRRSLLAPARSERGVLLERSGGGCFRLGAVLALPDAERGDAACVRVEIGVAVRAARAWSLSGPGDVRDLDIVPSQLVLLRSAGQSFARGTLVTVGHELGVRIVSSAADAARP